MSGVISFRTDDEVVDTVDRIADESDEDVSRALVTKRLVEEAVEARETPLWIRVGLSDRRAAKIEALRREGEAEEDLARDLFSEALEARERDILDELEIDDDLRERVEAAREEGETLDDAVRRLVRRGAEASTPRAEKLEVARTWAERLAVLFVVFAFALSVGESVLNSSIPILRVTGTEVVSVAIFVVLLFYVINRFRAWRAGRR